jgi:hypothetical protein
MIILMTLIALGCKNANPIKQSGIPRLSAKLAACALVYTSGIRIKPIMLDRIKNVPDIKKMPAIIFILIFAQLWLDIILL